MDDKLFNGKNISKYILKKSQAEEYAKENGIETPSFDDCNNEAINFYNQKNGVDTIPFNFYSFKNELLKNHDEKILIFKISDIENGELYFCKNEEFYITILDNNSNIVESKDMNKIDKIIKENLKRVLNESLYDLSDDEDPYSYGENMSIDEKEEELIENLGSETVLNNLLGYIGGDLREKFIAEIWQHYISNSF